MMSAGPILFSLLLLLSIEQRANCGRVESQDPDSSGTNAPGKELAASDKRIFVAKLPNTVDVKKLKAGDTLTAAPYPDDSAQDFAITSIRKNVHLEQGTVLIFSGSATELSQKPQS
jgi:hypothetical protein